MRISCTECHKLVELPEPIGLLGQFVCADCRRARNRTDATPIPNRPSAHDPPAALAARRAARASQPDIDPGGESGPPDVSELVAQVAPPQPAPSNPFALSFTPRQDISTHPTFDKPSTPAPAASALPATQPTPPPNAAAFDARPAQPYFAPPPAARPTPPVSAPPPPLIATPAFDAPARRGGSSAVKLVLLGAIVAAIAAGAAVLWRADSAAPVAPAAVTTPAVAAPAPPPTAAAQPVSAGDRPASDDFDRVAANEQLNKLAEEAGSCRKPDDPAGVARVQVTFEPSGAVKETTVEKGAASGKAVGKCLAKLFKDARVPPFKGEPVTITKSVVLR